MFRGGVRLVSLGELRGGRAIRLVCSHSLCDPGRFGGVSPVVVANTTCGLGFITRSDVAVDWNDSQNGGGDVREMHLE